jgi:hypothetical protein
MTQLRDLDMAKLNDAIFEGWRNLAPDELETLGALADGEGGGWFQTLDFGELGRVRVFWGPVLMCDVSLLSVRKVPKLDA